MLVKGTCAVCGRKYNKWLTYCPKIAHETEIVEECHDSRCKGIIHFNVQAAIDALPKSKKGTPPSALPPTKEPAVARQVKLPDAIEEASKASSVPTDRR